MAEIWQDKTTGRWWVSNGLYTCDFETESAALVAQGRLDAGLPPIVGTAPADQELTQEDDAVEEAEEVAGRKM